jgi:hypothetical protein
LLPVSVRHIDGISNVAKGTLIHIRAILLS